MFPVALPTSDQENSIGMHMEIEPFTQWCFPWDPDLQVEPSSWDPNMLNRELWSVSRIRLKVLAFHPAYFILYTSFWSCTSKGIFYTRRLIDNVRHRKYCFNRWPDICSVRSNLGHLQHLQSVRVIRAKLAMGMVAIHTKQFLVAMVWKEASNQKRF